MSEFTWRHGVVKVDDVYVFAEVILDEKGDEAGHTEVFMNSETLDGLQLLLDRLQRALDKYREEHQDD